MLESFTAECVAMWVGVVLSADSYNCMYDLPLLYESIRFLRSPDANWTHNDKPYRYMYVSPLFKSIYTLKTHPESAIVQI